MAENKFKLRSFVLGGYRVMDDPGGRVDLSSDSVVADVRRAIVACVRRIEPMVLLDALPPPDLSASF